MRGSFTSGRFHFEVERSDWAGDEARGFSEDLEDEEFDLRLTGTGKVPDLGGAPIASWLLARLARLADGRLGLAAEEHTDGGGYVIEFVVYLVPGEPDENASFAQPWLFNREELDVHVEPDRPVASFQFQADMAGAAVLGRRVPECPAEDVLEALAAALLAAPVDLLRCELAVRDPEWGELEVCIPRSAQRLCNRYGWDGSEFLGKDNTRDADLWD